MRKVKSKGFLVVWAFECFIRNEWKVTVKRLEQFLAEKGNLSTSTASDAVHSLLEDGVIVKVADKRRKGMPNGLQTIQWFNSTEIETFDQDLYCFECFKPGELIKCHRCTRCFHSSCVRKNPERPNYAVPVTNVIDEFEDEVDNNVTNTSELQPRLVPSSERIESASSVSSSPTMSMATVRPCRVVLVDVAQSLSLKVEVDDKSLVTQNKLPDVLFMGEVRPPTRQRANVSTPCTPNLLKNESEGSGDAHNSTTHLCTCCRMLENGQIRQPPNLSIDEMHHLLYYAFKRSRAWVKKDIKKQLESLKITPKYLSSIINILFQRRSLMSLNIINNNIKNKKYKLLVDILTDCLEWQFAIGVLFGSDSLFFDISKYFVRDLCYEIAEIKRCPDCYRHCNDRLTPFWFALPCVQRHELVFAKCPGHSFWPAKIIRVLRNAAIYDVRFFGGNHERSLVDSSSIKPIDMLSINLPNLLSFKKAMNELECYQTLAQYSPMVFSYSGRREQILDIIENVMGALTVDFRKISETVRNRKGLSTQNQSLAQLTSWSENELDSEVASSSRRIRSTAKRKPENRRSSPPKLMRLEICSNTNSPASITSTPSPLSGATTNYNSSTITIEQHIAEMNALRELHQREMNDSKEKLNELHQRELVIAKLKPYCVKCLQPAKFLCCIHAWYCSKVCQRQHWYEGHDKQCDNSTMPNNGS